MMKLDNDELKNKFLNGIKNEKLKMKNEKLMKKLFQSF